jgi:hypothetical protein
MIQIIWDYLSPRNERWCEWVDENGKTHLKRVTEEEYAVITAKPTESSELDFLS